MQFDEKFYAFTHIQTYYSRVEANCMDFKLDLSLKYLFLNLWTEHHIFGQISLQNS